MKKTRLFLVVINLAIILLFMIPSTQSFLNSASNYSDYFVIIAIMLVGLLSFNIVSFFNIKSWDNKIVLIFVLTCGLCALGVGIMVLIYGLPGLNIM